MDPATTQIDHDKNAKKLYETLQSEEFDVPEFDQFRMDIRDEKNLTVIRKNLIDLDYDLPEIDQMKSDLIPPQKKKVGGDVSDSEAPSTSSKWANKDNAGKIKAFSAPAFSKTQQDLEKKREYLKANQVQLAAEDPGDVVDYMPLGVPEDREKLPEMPDDKNIGPYSNTYIPTEKDIMFEQKRLEAIKEHINTRVSEKVEEYKSNLSEPDLSGYKKRYEEYWANLTPMQKRVIGATDKVGFFDKWLDTAIKDDIGITDYEGYQNIYNSVRKEIEPYEIQSILNSQVTVADNEIMRGHNRYGPNKEEYEDYIGRVGKLNMFILKDKYEIDDALNNPLELYSRVVNEYSTRKMDFGDDLIPESSLHQVMFQKIMFDYLKHLKSVENYDRSVFPAKREVSYIETPEYLEALKTMEDNSGGVGIKDAGIRDLNLVANAIDYQMQVLKASYLQNTFNDQTQLYKDFSDMDDPENIMVFDKDFDNTVIKNEKLKMGLAYLQTLYSEYERALMKDDAMKQMILKHKDQQAMRERASERYASGNVKTGEVMGLGVASGVSSSVRSVASIPKRVGLEEEVEWLFESTPWTGFFREPGQIGEDIQMNIPEQLTGPVYKNGKLNTDALIFQSTAAGTELLIDLFAVGKISKALKPLNLGTKADRTVSWIAANFATNNDAYFQSAMNAGLDEKQANNYSMAMSIMMGTIETISPNTVISGESTGVFQRSVVKALKDGSTMKQAFINGLKTIGKEVGKENVEEQLQMVAEALFNRGVNNLLGTSSLKEDISRQEMIDTFLVTTATIGPMTAGRAKFNTSQVDKIANYESAKNPENTKAQAKKMIQMGLLNESDYDKVSQKADLNSKILESLPDDLSDDQKMELVDRISRKKTIQESLKDSDADEEIKKYLEFEYQFTIDKLNEEINDIITRDTGSDLEKELEVMERTLEIDKRLGVPEDLLEKKRQEIEAFKNKIDEQKAKPKRVQQTGEEPQVVQEKEEKDKGIQPKEADVPKDLKSKAKFYAEKDRKATQEKGEEEISEEQREAEPLRVRNPTEEVQVESEKRAEIEPGISEVYKSKSDPRYSVVRQEGELKVYSNEKGNIVKTSKNKRKILDEYKEAAKQQISEGKKIDIPGDVATPDDYIREIADKSESGSQLAEAFIMANEMEAQETAKDIKDFIVEYLPKITPSSFGGIADPNVIEGLSYRWKARKGKGGKSYDIAVQQLEEAYENETGLPLPPDIETVISDVIQENPTRKKYDKTGPLAERVKDKFYSLYGFDIDEDYANELLDLPDEDLSFVEDLTEEELDDILGTDVMSEQEVSELEEKQWYREKYLPKIEAHEEEQRRTPKEEETSSAEVEDVKTEKSEEEKPDLDQMREDIFDILKDPDDDYNTDDTGKIMSSIFPVKSLLKILSIPRKYMTKFEEKIIAEQTDKLEDWMSKGVQKGITNSNTAARQVSQLLTSLYDGLPRTQEEVAKKRMFRGSLNLSEIKAKKLRDSLYAMVNEDYQSLENVAIVMDPDLTMGSETTDPDYWDTPGDNGNTPREELYDGLNEHEKKLYDTLRQINDYTHEYNYQQGLITEETYKKYKGRYIGRLQEKYYAGVNDVEVDEFIYTSKGKLNLNIYKKRQELNEDLAEGVIKDPVFATAVRLMQTEKNLAVMSYLNYVNDEIKDAVVEVDEGEVSPKGYIKLSGKGYGPLDGKYVVNYIAQDIKGYFMANEMLDNLYIAVKMYDRIKLRQFYKKLHTVFSPGVIIGNYVSNFVFAQWAGINPVLFASKQPKAFKELKNKGKIYELLVKEGILGTDVITNDWMPLTKESIDRAKTMEKIKTDMFSRARKSLQKIDDKLTNFYAGTDDLAKISAFLAFTENYGYSEGKAIEMVYKSFQNYATVGKAWDVAAKTPVFGNAYIKFQADLQRLVKNAVSKRTLSTAMYIGALHLMAQAASGWSDEEEEEKKIREARDFIPKIPTRDLPGNIIRDTPLMFQTPYGEVNLARYIAPFYLYSKGEGEDDLEFWSKFTPFQFRRTDESFGIAMDSGGDPLLSPWYEAFVIDRDFRGKSIQDPESTKWKKSGVTIDERRWNAFNYIFRSQVPMYKTAQDMYMSMEEGVDFYGRDRSPEQVLMSMVLKVEEFEGADYTKAAENKLKSVYFQRKRLEREVKNIKTVIQDNIEKRYKMYKDGRISEKKFLKYKKEQVQLYNKRLTVKLEELAKQQSKLNELKQEYSDLLE